MSKLDYALIRKIDKAVDNRFVYVLEDGDEWTSRAVEFLSDPNYIIRDDCDTKASTVLDLLSRKGFPDDRLFRVVVKSPQATKSDYIDHMVGMVQVDSGTYYIVGDTFTYGKPTRLDKTVHELVQISRVDWGLEWRDYVDKSSLI